MSKINFAMFMAGLTIGSAATWLCLKKRYEQIAQEEIDSVKAVFAEKKPETVIRKEENLDKDNKIKANQAKLKPDLINYAAKLAEEGYTNYASATNKNEKDCIRNFTFSSNHNICSKRRIKNIKEIIR